MPNASILSMRQHEKNPKPDHIHPGAQAIKLKDGFMELYKSKGGPGLTADKLKAASIGWADIFEEIPVSVQNSNLVSALMAQVRISEHSAGQSRVGCGVFRVSSQHAELQPRLRPHAAGACH